MKEKQKSIENSQNNAGFENIKIDLKSGKIDTTADDKLTKSELKAIENILTRDVSEIVYKSKEELNSLKRVIIKDLTNRLKKEPENKHISNLLRRTQDLLDTVIFYKEKENPIKKEKSSNYKKTKKTDNLKDKKINKKTKKIDTSKDNIKTDKESNKEGNITIVETN